MKQLWLAVLFGGLVLPACDSSPSTSITPLPEVPPASVPGVTLPGTSPLPSRSSLEGAWELLAMEQPNGETIQIPNPKDYTARFDSEDVINIKADCNLCSGNYEVNGSSLTVDPVMACTLAMCLPGSHSDTYIAAMGEATSYTRSGSGLDIRYRDNGLLRFRAGE